MRRPIQIWGFTDAAERDNTGNDDGLRVGDLALVGASTVINRATAVLASTSTWAQLAAFDKADADTQVALSFAMAGATQWEIRHSSAEDLEIRDGTAALFFSCTTSDDTIQARTIRPTSDSTHNLGTTAIRWATVFADLLDVGVGTTSPTVSLNKSAAGTAALQFRQTQGADTDGDCRIVFDGSEILALQGRVSGSFGSIAAVRPGVFTADAALALNATVLDDTIDADDWNPGGVWPAANRIRSSPAANIATGGLLATNVVDGQLVLLVNVSTANTITLEHEEGTSTAANRFACPGAVDFAVQPRGSVWLCYESALTRWRVVGP